MGYYRYGPEASVSNTMGVYAPPAWVMLYFAPNEKEVLREKDVEKLEEKYGIVLNFGKDSPKDN